MSEFLYLSEMEEKIKKKDKEYYIGIGLCLGVALGAAFDNIGLGIGLGLVFGVAMQKLKKSSK
jgi:hypothetical protein